MKILLLGGSGQVGFELARSLAPLGTVVAPSRAELDLSSEEAVTDYLTLHQPELIANAAAWTAVDAAEQHVDAARRLNAGLPEQLAQYCAEKGALLVHYSSDYVYPGDGSEPWLETSATGPLSVYGQTKLEGDLAIQQSGAKHLIFRTSWVYSARGNNFMKTMLRLAESKPELSVVADQVGAPTPARLVAQITALAIYRDIPLGLYHLAPRGSATWHEFAVAIVNLASMTGKLLSSGPADVLPVSTSSYVTPAKRPMNSQMDLSKIESALRISLPGWYSQLELTLDEYLEKQCAA
ncbi:dTDP-4-dehydrorhamnose reductase [Marinobacter salinexigens]|uniref:dTDP-4-dehydrorhamnose reductase n=1 Tax=Marinobacter salinexigens TaxID=2919747 RepID=A0A5B0VKN9_9GAMM|nr:dTDP-4-dehydrorhamnose reductase [Marinobacter salinexigens]KAA1174675.1 dTDP-4-dehydrorhamnose reductase [Marinobacter salinexigens]